MQKREGERACSSTPEPARSFTLASPPFDSYLMSDHIKKLQKFLNARGQSTNVESLTADASTREYFRIRWHGESAVACVYPEAFIAAEPTYLDVTSLFLAAGLPVAAILDVDGDLGVIIQEDLGDRILRNVMSEADSETAASLLDEAIRLIPRIQAATGKAYEMNSVASRLKFDTEKLLWELNFFKTHYFATFLKRPLSVDDDARLSDEFADLASELDSMASVLCHRDFHAFNLMIDPRGKMRIIDHQDARIGSPAYDLVSLLLDRVTEIPTADWIAEKWDLLFDEREKLGLAKIDEAEFAYEFLLQTIQRCLKAAGTFSYQSETRGKTYFVPFIKPMLQIAVRAAESLERFPAIQEILNRDII